MEANLIVNLSYIPARVYAQPSAMISSVVQLRRHSCSIKVQLVSWTYAYRCIQDQAESNRKSRSRKVEHASGKLSRREVPGEQARRSASKVEGDACLTSFCKSPHLEMNRIGCHPEPHEPHPASSGWKRQASWAQSRRRVMSRTLNLQAIPESISNPYTTCPPSCPCSRDDRPDSLKNKLSRTCAWLLQR